MKIYFTLSADQFANVKDKRYTLYNMNFLNLTASREKCIEFWEASRAFGNFPEPEYDTVFVCSGEVNDDDVCVSLQVAADESGSNELEVRLDDNVYRYQREILLTKVA